MSGDDFFLVGLVVLTMGMVAGAMVVGGGWEALRRQVWKFVAVGLGVLAISAAYRFIGARFGTDILTIPLVVVSVALLALMLRQNRRRLQAA